ncbi:MAG: amino acid ABC transporter substrate-binding protein [Desulfobacter sp.]|nr:amino acid ABC transporter substrate-binding protein [Desulfobacter sp.]WDP84486.1 MAG: amino acid ABC transporter substrate-binding protein [Desulfobacter sp.]
MKKILVLLACLFALSSVCYAGDGSLDRIKESKKLVIGLDDSFPPMGYRVADGTLVGFDVDAAQEVGKRLGLEIVWKPTAWSGVVHSLNSKMFDCIWNGMTITPERQEKVAFTKPYIMDGQIAVVRFAEKRFKTHKDLGNTIIGAQKDSSAIKAIGKMENQPKEVKEYADNPKALLDLEAGRTDAVVIDNVAGRHAISKRIGKFKALPGNISKEPFGIAFRKADADLLNAVQKTIDEMIADGTMAKISKKWFAEDITNPEKW